MGKFKLGKYTLKYLVLIYHDDVWSQYTSYPSGIARKFVPSKSFAACVRKPRGPAYDNNVIYQDGQISSIISFSNM